MSVRKSFFQFLFVTDVTEMALEQDRHRVTASVMSLRWSFKLSVFCYFYKHVASSRLITP